MLKSVISSAANLSLAPARLVGRMAGSLVRELRGHDAPRSTTRRRSSAPAKPTSRSRRRAQPKRAASHTQAKAQSRHGTPRPGGKSKPATSRAQAKRAAPRTRAKAQPKRTPQRKPLDDVTVARKVESIIFRDVEVDKGTVDVNVAEGVLWLRGEVPTPDLIDELEARANRITEVRRVENLLHLPPTSAPGRTEPSRGETARPGAGLEEPVSHGETSEEPRSPRSALSTTNAAAVGRPPSGAPLGTADAAPKSEDGTQEDEEPAAHDEPERGAASEDPDQQT